MVTRRSWCVLLSFFPLLLSAQQFGGNPASVRWLQLNSPNVKVIYPRGLDSQARRVASLADFLHRATASTIGTDSRKISVILQSQTTFSNGYVQLAPWRSEFFLTPLQNSLQLGSLSWTDQLAIHEYRHVQQYMNFRHGLSKLAYFIAGEEGQVLANSGAIPDWFYEGDAVFQETLVSGQGRGRLPDFFSGYRSLWQDDLRYSYMKLRNGSLKHEIPDHYPLGYLLIAYGRKTYGDDFWKKVTRDAVRYKPLFYPFQGAVKRYAGKPYRDFVRDALGYYRGLDMVAPGNAKAQVNAASRSGLGEAENELTGIQADSNSEPYRNEDPATMITKPSKGYVKQYQFPNKIGVDSLIAYRNTGRQLPAWVLIKDGEEKKIGIRDISAEPYYSYRNGKIAYVAYKPDIRWDWRDYSNIRIYDIHTGERRTLTRKGKYFAPEISRDGMRVAAVFVEEGGASVLQLLDAGNGSVVREWRGTGLFFTYPKFSAGEVAIFSAVRNREGKMSLVKVDIASGDIEPILPYTFQAIAFPYVSGDSLFFTASRNGVDRAMVWNDSGKKLYQVLSRYTGAHQPVPAGGGNLVFSSLTAWGNQLFTGRSVSIPVSREEWAAENNDLYLPQTLLPTAGRIDSAAAGDYEVRKYSKGTGLLNIHSWRPYYEQPEWSFSVYGQNVLNTIRHNFYYAYNENEKSHRIGYDGIYAGWFPWLIGGVSYTFDRKAVVSYKAVHWDELNANIGLRVPLNFSGGRTYKFLTLSSTWNTQQLYFPKEFSADFYNLHFHYLDNLLTWQIQTQQATQQIFPRFAHTLSARYTGSITGTEAHQLLVKTSLYLPGILPTHSLVIDGAYQSRDTADQYRFSNNFPLSRGYPAVNLPRMWKIGVNYHFPILYPDWGFGQILYFLRIRGNVFYDYSSVKSLRTGEATPLRSYGAELYFDTKWWNQQELSIGIRYSHLVDADKYRYPPNANQWQVVLPINLIPK